MTKQQITSHKDLVKAKVAVINYHEGTENEYIRFQCAKDACYTSFNSIQWKHEQMSEIKNELQVARAENKDSEVVSVKVSSKTILYRKMEAELVSLEERHKADLEVHKIITGDAWQYRPKRTHKSDGLGDWSEVDAILAS
jgi:hypothetical protein|tara:strand:- start:269 stop:688 length:420 start_codon:yes stop_codon:yes gene_type:complete